MCVSNSGLPQLESNSLESFSYWYWLSHVSHCMVLGLEPLLGGLGERNTGILLLSSLPAPAWFPPSPPNPPLPPWVEVSLVWPAFEFSKEGGGPSGAVLSWFPSQAPGGCDSLLGLLPNSCQGEKELSPTCPSGARLCLQVPPPYFPPLAEVLNLLTPCLHLTSTGITGRLHQAQLMPR